jgi:hypothetical protein
MIYDIEDGIFDRDAIEAACTNHGYQMLKFHFTEGNDGRENKFFAWLAPIEPSAGLSLESLYGMEAELQDTDDDDDISLSVEIRGDVVEIRVYE